MQRADRSQPPAASPRESAADGGREGDRRGSRGSIPAGARRRFASGSGSAGRRCTVPRSAPCTRSWTATAWCGGAGDRAAAPGRHAALPAGRARIALWCADYKGEFLLANRRYCYPLTITDFASRYLLACEALSTTKERYAFTVFERAFQEFGLPEAIRTDNGVPFASAHALYGLSKLGRLVAAPRHRPRAHRARASRAKWPARAAASDAEDRSDAARRRRTSCSSRRASIPSCTSSTTSGRTRRSTWRRPPAAISRRRGPIRASRSWSIPRHDWTAVITTCGRICYQRRKINVSQVFAGQKVGVKQVDEHIWLVTFMHYDLGYFDDETCRLEPIDNPFGPKLLPMSPE